MSYWFWSNLQVLTQLKKREFHYVITINSPASDTGTPFQHLRRVLHLPKCTGYVLRLRWSQHRTLSRVIHPEAAWPWGGQSLLPRERPNDASVQDSPRVPVTLLLFPLGLKGTFLLPSHCHCLLFLIKVLLISNLQQSRSCSLVFWILTLLSKKKSKPEVSYSSHCSYKMWKLTFACNFQWPDWAISGEREVNITSCYDNSKI